MNAGPTDPAGPTHTLPNITTTSIAPQEDPASGLASDPLTADEARALTDDIRAGLTVALTKLTAAFAGRAWEALGYDDWESYCATEFAESRMFRLPVIQRAEVIDSLRRSGMSTRAIGSALGVGKSTVGRTVATVPDGTDDRPATVTSLDGRTRPATQPAVPKREPMVDDHAALRAHLANDPEVALGRYRDKFMYAVLDIYRPLAKFDIPLTASKIGPEQLAEFETQIRAITDYHDALVAAMPTATVHAISAGQSDRPASDGAPGFSNYMQASPGWNRHAFNSQFLRAAGNAIDVLKFPIDVAADLLDQHTIDRLDHYITELSRYRTDLIAKRPKGLRSIQGGAS